MYLNIEIPIKLTKFQGRELFYKNQQKWTNVQNEEKVTELNNS